MRCTTASYAMHHSYVCGASQLAVGNEILLGFTYPIGRRVFPSEKIKKPDGLNLSGSKCIQPNAQLPELLHSVCTSFLIPGGIKMRVYP